MAQDEKDRKAKEEQSASPVGELSYEFFQPNFTELEYSFSTPPAGSLSTPSPDPLLSPLPPVPQMPDSVATKPELVPIQAEANEPRVEDLPASLEPVQSLQESHPSVPPSYNATKPSTPELGAGPVRQIVTAGGALATYQMWHLRPSRIDYKDGTWVEFDFDGDGRTCAVRRSGAGSWIRIADPDEDGFALWERDSVTTVLRYEVVPDGTYQCVERTGATTTYTTDGKRFVGLPFKPDFDLRGTLTKIFSKLDSNGDGTVTKLELDRAVLLDWKDPNASQLVAMLKFHFDRILNQRTDLFALMAGGLTIEDIIAYDKTTSEIMRKLQDPPDSAEQALDDLFSRLDTDRDGMVTLEQIELHRTSPSQLAQDGEFLEIILNHTHKLHSLGREGFIDKSNWIYLSDLRKLFRAAYKEEIGKRIAIDAWGLEEHWQLTRSSSTAIFAREPAAESIRIEAIKQGSVGDCLFLAALGAAVCCNPKLIMSAIEQNADGTCTVRFAGDPDRPVTIETPNTLELALYARGSEYGIWAPVLEKAYAMYLLRDGKKRALIPQENIEARDDVIALLTGQSAQWYPLEKMTLQELREMLRGATRQRRAVLACALGFLPKKAGQYAIVNNHAYTVMRFNVETDEVTLRNPWGVVSIDGTSTNENPKLTLQDGTNGIFAVPLSEFARAFSLICVEEWANG